MTEDVLIKLAAILVVGVSAQWIAWRFRLPSILLLLIAGIVIGPVSEFVDPDELLGDLLIPIVSLSVGLILFEGGLSLRVADLGGTAGVVRNLVSIGAAVTWFVGAVAGWLLFDIDLSLAILLGAILVVTGPTVIGPLLDHVRPTGRIGPVLRWEGIVIDPIGAILAVLVFEALLQDQLDEAALETALAIVITLGAGGAAGVAGAALTVILLRRYLVPDALQNSVTLMLVVAVVTVSNEIQDESGLLAATIMGIALANQRLVNVRHIVEFKENIRVLLLGGLFVVLGARLSIEDITDFGLERAAFLVILILVARPLSVAVSTAGSALNWRERAFIAAMAPRGIVAAAVASIFALRLAEEGSEDAGLLVPLTFTVIIGTIAVYGLAATPIARRLNVSHPNPQGVLFVGGQAWARQIAKAVHDLGFPVLIVDSNRRNINDARMEGLPAHFGNILADYTPEELDLTGIGRVVSMTPNDEVNALAGQRFIAAFGRANIFQLAPRGESDGRGASVSVEQRGRVLFGRGLNYAYLAQRFANGAVVKTTELTEEFTYDAFLTQYESARPASDGEERPPDDSYPRAERAEGADLPEVVDRRPEELRRPGVGNVVPLFLVTQDREIRVFTEDNAPAPRPGQTLISLLDDPGTTPAARAEERREGR